MDFYLPDTNIFIYAHKGEEPYARNLSAWITNNNLLISAIVMAEFLSGGEELERDKFQSLIDRFGTVAIDTSVARITADYKLQFIHIKPKLKLPDALIAATCKLYGATLVTDNLTDFPMKDIKKLRLTYTRLS